MTPPLDAELLEMFHEMNYDSLDLWRIMMCNNTVWKGIECGTIDGDILECVDCRYARIGKI